MIPKIALEEHVLFQMLRDYWEPTVKDLAPPLYSTILGKLTDFGDGRLAAMAGAGIARAVLSVAGPGVQAEPDGARATHIAALANDALATETSRRPDRYSGFAHIALQDPVAAADELERCVRSLGFVGAMINGHSQGRYLDDPALYPFWERAEALNVPIYLHPADPVAPYATYQGHKVLARATWGWTIETGTHALRCVFSGLFDRFPKAQLVLGHMGETLPYQLWRFDSRAKLYGAKLVRTPSDYIKQNIHVTISGMYSREPLDCAVAALGAGRVMFAADYPFENIEDGAGFMDSVALPDDVKAQIAWKNAAELLNIAVA